MWEYFGGMNMEEVYIIFQDRELSTNEDYQDDGFIVVWDSEEVGRNLTTCQLIEAVGKYDNDIYQKVINYVFQEYELVYGDKPDTDDLDSMYFEEVFEFIAKEIGEGIFYKFHYQSVPFIYRLVATKEQAEDIVKYYSENQAYKRHKYFYTRYKVES